MENLLLDDSEWSSLSERLEDPFFGKLHERNEQAVRIMLEQGKDDFWALGSDLRAESLERGNPWRWRILKHRLYRFTVSWRLTGEQVSLDEALRAVDVLTDRQQWRIEFSGAGIRHADLRTGDLWTCACFALEALEPALSEQQRSGLIALLREWALPAYQAGWRDADWWRHAEFNWGAAVHGAAGLAALMLRRIDPELSEASLKLAREGLSYVIDYMPEGGGWIEGLMYQTTTLAHLTDFVAANHRVLGDDLGLSQNPRLRQSFDFRLWMIGGDGHPLNFSNCNERSNEWRLPHAYWWAHRCGCPEWAGFEDAFPREWFDTHGVFLDIEAFWFRQPQQPSSAWTQPQGLRHARELDWLSWKRGQAWLGFRSGTNAGNHTNRDLGQVIFGMGGERVLCDPGYGASSVAQHSCLSLGGHEQAHGATAKLFRVREIRQGKQDLLYLCCDLTETYEPYLNFHYRHIVASSQGWILILDHLMARRGRRLGVRGQLQLRAQPEMAGPEAGESPWRLKESEHGFRVEFLTPVTRVEPSSWEWGDLPVHTLAYRLAEDLPLARMAVLLTPSQATPPTLAIANDEARLEADDLSLAIDLSEGSVCN